MYNRYIPKDDGSFQKRSVPEQHRIPSTQQPVHPPQEQYTPPPSTPPPSRTAGSFLRNLLPKNFDTGDLFIVLLLLLMAGDREEDQNTALLTLALYFFM